jgi:hypothetical protein
MVFTLRDFHDGTCCFRLAEDAVEELSFALERCPARYKWEAQDVRDAARMAVERMLDVRIRFMDDEIHALAL